MKMGPRTQITAMSNYSESAPVIILETGGEVYNADQVIISNDLPGTDLTKFASDSLYVGDPIDEARLSITVIDNNEAELLGTCGNMENENFDVLNGILDYNNMNHVPVLESEFPEAKSHVQAAEDQSNAISRGEKVGDEMKKADGPLECILENLLIKSKDPSEESPSSGCKRPAHPTNGLTQKKFRGEIKEPETVKKTPAPCEDIQILKIETKPPKTTPVDRDLTSLNWLHKLNIVSVPSLPTPPSSPTFQKNPIKKPNSLSLRLQYGKAVISPTAIHITHFFPICRYITLPGDDGEL